MNQNDHLDETEIVQEIENRLAEFNQERGSLIPLLQMIQDQCQYLPKASFEIVGHHLDISSAEVFGVATFYNQFRFHPPGTTCRALTSSCALSAVSVRWSVRLNMMLSAGCLRPKVYR